ncbi:copper homeostasis protein [Stemphylium lycopersici]|nr:copper homeostasis protein [Stemphylium lycopersici]
MIRPRGGDFNYSAEEFVQMKEEMNMLKPLASGFVFGILDSNNLVDDARNRELVQMAAPLACTFHRAIDETKDLEMSVEAVINCGFKSVLTSGSMRNALEGAEQLGRIQKKYGRTLSIIAGGGVRRTNIEELRAKAGVTWLHSAAITQHGEDVDELEVKKMQILLAALERQ